MNPDQLPKLFAGEPFESSNPQIGKELQEFVKRYQPKPKVYLTYERDAMFCKDDAGLRITIDSKIRYKMYEPGMDFVSEGMPVMPDETMFLMEVKAPGCMPAWLIEGLSSLGIYQASFSKIGTAFTRYIAPQLRFGRPVRQARKLEAVVRPAHAHMRAAAM